MGTSTHKELFRGFNREFSERLIGIVHGMDEYWPLTVRQVYYQAVAALLIENRQAEYKRVSKVLTTLRRDNRLPWHAIEDRVRRTIDKRGVSDVQAWASEQMESFMDWRYYHRCYVQEQSVYVEVATEKDALSSILERAVWSFCTRLNVVRGQVSATMVNSMAERYEKAVWMGKRPVLIYMGDLDPSGVSIPKALQRNLRDHHGIDVELIRAALNPGQVKAYGLPESLDAAKRSDPNYKAWASVYGNQSPVELDALHPIDLQDITRQALMQAYDMSGLEKQIAIEEEERRLITTIRRRVESVLYSEFPEIFNA